MHYPYPFAFVGRFDEFPISVSIEVVSLAYLTCSYEIKSSNLVTPFGLFASGSSTQDTLSVTFFILSKLSCGQLMSPYCD